MSFQRHLLPSPLDYFEEQGLTITGSRKGKWFTTECRFHGGSDSMRVHQETGTWVCMACGVKGGDLVAYEIQSTQDEFIVVAKRLGAWIEDGTSNAYKPTLISPRLALQVLEIEANLVCVAAGNLANGTELTQVDRDRIYESARRIHVISGVFK
jgi:hypothetical protein